jgi:hypothetical protein
MPKRCPTSPNPIASVSNDSPRARTASQSASLPHTAKARSPLSPIKSLVCNILRTSPYFPRLYADVVISSAPNSNETNILAATTKKIIDMTNRSAVHQSVTHRAGGASNVDQGNGAFQLVVAGLVKEVAETHDSYRFADEVHRQTRRGAAEHADHGIQFLSATLQVGACYGEVCTVQSRGRE